MSRPALIFGALGEIVVTFDELEEQVTQSVTKFRHFPSDVLLLRAEATLVFVRQFLASIRAGQPVAVLAADLNAGDFAHKQNLLGPHFEIDANDEITSEEMASGVRHDSQAKLLLFTSGSTGTPKVVQLSQQNIEANTQAVIESLRFVTADFQYLYLKLSYSFGLLGQLLPALECGITTRFVDGPLQAAQALLDDDGSSRVMLSGVPSQWEIMIRAVGGKCERVSHVVSAGSSFRKPLRERLQTAFPRAVVFNNYGLTEASPRVLSLPSTDSAFFTDAVGRAVGEWELKCNSSGELLIKGPQVMLGYLHDQYSLFDTADRTNNGWLRTGDLAEIDDTGLVRILGRNDDLFKISGERTSPLEIENALKSLPFVTDAAVAQLDDEIFGARLVAILVGSDEDLLAKKPAAYVVELAKELPAQKIPKKFYLAQDLPKTENGKLKRRGLSDVLKSAKEIK